jgi:hypothetical protein
VGRFGLDWSGSGLGQLAGIFTFLLHIVPGELFSGKLCSILWLNIMHTADSSCQYASCVFLTTGVLINVKY